MKITPFGLMALLVLVSLASPSFAQEKTSNQAAQSSTGSTQSTQTQTSATEGTLSGNTASFKALAPIPGLTDSGTVSNDLPSFLNKLYIFAIGIAVVLAILQIIRGGVEYMGGDSVTNKEQGRNHITQALLGLLLVLAPTIVFGVINGDLLKMRFAVDSLTISGGSGTQTSQGSGLTDQQEAQVLQQQTQDRIELAAPTNSTNTAPTQAECASVVSATECASLGCKVQMQETPGIPGDSTFVGCTAPSP